MNRQLENNSWVKTTCPYCGVGCGVDVKVGFNNSVLIRGDRDHPSNAGKLCSKGTALADTLVPDDRLLHPTVDGELVSWDTALSAVAEGFTEVIRQYGPDATAFYVSGQLLTEDYYVANKLMKGFIGSANIDTNSRLCMSSSVEGHKRAFGSDTVPGCYEDLELADLVVIAGANMAWCHPVLFQRIKAAKEQNSAMRVVVIDPRMTATCTLADIHIGLDPGTDVALFNGLLAYLAIHNGINQDYLMKYVEGGPETIHYALSVYGSMKLLAKQIGVEERQLEQFYRFFLETEKVVTIYSQGVNQSIHGVDKVNSIINCHLATGRIGKPGMGPFSVTGQPNAMGGREVGGMASALAAHMDIGNSQHRDLVSTFWGTDKIPHLPGLTAVELINGVDRGDIKAIWIMGTNPAVSMPDVNRVVAALQACPLVVVSDCIQNTDTARFANILLPSAGWSEKSGTVTNSERRISRQRAFMDMAGESKPDWWIICEVAKRMGYGQKFPFKHEYEIFLEHARLSGYENHGQRSFNISGLSALSKEEYENFKPQQWPISNGQTKSVQAQNKRFFTQGKFLTPHKKARMIPLLNLKGASSRSDKYPLTLNTGRIRDQWHGMSRTGLSSRLSANHNEPYLEIHPVDAKIFGLRKGDLAQVESRWGAAVLPVMLSVNQKQGQLFMPIHWTGRHASQGKAGPLIGAFTDAISGQPEFKMTPVRIRLFPRNSEALIVVREPKTFLQCDYWVRQKISGGYAYHLASQVKPHTLMAQLKDQLITSDQQTYSFEDDRAGQYRFVVSVDSRVNTGVVVAKRLEPSVCEWLKLILDDVKGRNGVSAIVSGKPEASLYKGKILCICRQVGHNEIDQAIKENNLLNVDEICEMTQAGTGCGSCLPELEILLRRQEV